MDGTDLHHVDWKHVSVPGAVCGSARPIQLAGTALIRSRLWPWWPRVVVSGGPPVTYGDVTGDGRDEAAFVVECSNGGGTADGQIAFAAVVYTGSAHNVRVLGIVTPRQPFQALAVIPVPLLNVTLRHGEVISHEFWYGPHDGTCCSSGRATTTWRYRHGALTPRRTVVTRKPH